MNDIRPGYLHVEEFAWRHTPPKRDAGGLIGKPGERGIRAILAEGSRVFASTPHIPSPQAPTIVFGVIPVAILPELEAMATEGRYAKGYKLRPDAKTLMAGTAGYPYSCQFLRDNPAAVPELFRWIDLCALFLKNAFPETLRSVVLHLDEPYPHLHFYAIPTRIGDIVLVDEVHPGRRASATADKSCNDDKARHKTRRDAYTAALRTFQNDYYVQVSAPLGHARYGKRNHRVPLAQIRALEAEREAMLRVRQDQDRQWEAIANGKRMLEEREAKADEERLLSLDMHDAYRRELDAVRHLKSELTTWAHYVRTNGMTVPSEVETLLQSALALSDEAQP